MKQIKEHQNKNQQEINERIKLKQEKRVLFLSSYNLKKINCLKLTNQNKN